MKTIEFNTGRKYTADGQRIKATLHDDRVVTFFDHSRGISGEFDMIGDVFTRDTVMAAYDGNAYRQSTRSWQDGMMKGGCNS